MTAGTIFEGTRKPLRDWLRAIWYVSSRKSGVSALGLQRELNLPSYGTAWTWLHKLRTVMVSPEVRLSGQVQVDQVALNGSHPHSKKLHAPVVAIAAEIEANTLGRIRLLHLTDLASDQLLQFVDDVIAPAAMLESWFWHGPAGLIRQEANATAGVFRSVGGIDRTPLTHTGYVASMIERWLRGTYCRATDIGHLAFYLDEFTFRANHRRTVNRGELFHILLSSAVRSGNARPEPKRASVAGMT